MHRFRSTLGKARCIGQDEKASAEMIMEVSSGKMGSGFLSPCACKQVDELLWKGMHIGVMGYMVPLPLFVHNWQHVCLCVDIAWM